MEIRMALSDYDGDYDICITTNHPASSYGKPVVLVDGELVDLSVTYEADLPCERTALDLLADAAGIHNGECTRRALANLAEEMGGAISGAACDAVIAEFSSRRNAGDDHE